MKAFENKPGKFIGYFDFREDLQIFANYYFGNIVLPDTILMKLDLVLIQGTHYLEVVLKPDELSTDICAEVPTLVGKFRLFGSIAKSGSPIFIVDNYWRRTFGCRRPDSLLLRFIRAEAGLTYCVGTEWENPDMFLCRFIIVSKSLCSASSHRQIEQKRPMTPVSQKVMTTVFL